MNKVDLKQFSMKEEADREDDDENNPLNNSLTQKINKVKKFKSNSNPNQLKNFLKISCIAIIFFMITLTDFVLNEYLNLNMEWLSENQKTLGELKIDVNFQYASIYQAIALGIPDYKVDDVVVREYYL